MSGRAQIKVEKTDDGKWRFEVVVAGIQAACGGFTTKAAAQKAAEDEARHMAKVLS